MYESGSCKIKLQNKLNSIEEEKRPTITSFNIDFCCFCVLPYVKAEVCQDAFHVLTI